jgi:hypothetical protein
VADGRKAHLFGPVRPACALNARTTRLSALASSKSLIDTSFQYQRATLVISVYLFFSYLSQPNNINMITKPAVDEWLKRLVSIMTLK